MNLIDRLKELDARATPGPWNVDPCGDIYHNGKSQIVMREQSEPNIDFATTAYWSEGNPNAQLMVEMRNALPKLLAVIEQAECLTDMVGAALKVYSVIQDSSLKDCYDDTRSALDALELLDENSVT